MSINNQLREIRKKIDWVVRYGGEEFLIVLPETKHLGAYSMAERLRKSVAETKIKAGAHDLQITASFGGACAEFQNKNTDDLSMDHLINRADEQLYRCKKEGRNRTCVIEYSLNESC